MRSGWSNWGSIIVAAALAVAAGCTKKEPPKPTWADAARAQLAEGSPKNLVLVTIDTLRADALGAYGSQRKTPHLDAFAAQAVVFEQAFATAPFTGPSHASILTSRHPSKHGVIFNGHRVRSETSPESVPVSEHLKAQGFATGAVVSARPSPVQKKYGFARGFDRYEQSCKPAHGDVAADGACIVERSRRWLSQRGEDEAFFLWVHLFDPHFPYIGPEEMYEAQGLDAKELVVTRMNVLKSWDDDRVRKAYLADVYEGDHYFGELMKALTDLGLMRNTVVAITSDHGEYLGEHGKYDHSGLYDEALRVPLMIAGPGITPERRIDLVSTIDIVPTALEILGLPPMTSAQGRSVRTRPAKSLPVFAEWRHFRVVKQRDKARKGDFQIGTRTKTNKLIVDWLFPEDGTMLFDLRKDPGEQRNLFKPSSPLAKTMGAKLDQHIERDLDAEHIERSDIELDPKTLEMLQALGYVE